LAGRVAGRVAARLDLGGATAMLDVGGGTGAYSAALCEVNPGLAATVLDTPEVAALGAAAIAGTAVEGRVRFAGGDYMDQSAYGGPHGLVLFANVLHQETPDRASRMIALGAGALAPGGLLAIVDFSIDDERRASRIGTLFAINMRSFGDTHSASAIRGWTEEAGLGSFARIDLDGTRWILTARKPARIS
jgi:trans-aconitate methyltransferase